MRTRSTPKSMRGEMAKMNQIIENNSKQSPVSEHRRVTIDKHMKNAAAYITLSNQTQDPEVYD